MAMSDNLNYKRFGIMDVNAAQVAAGAGFQYRNYIISMSQIFIKSPSVVVFNNDDPAELVYDAKSVEDAIDWCNRQG